MGFGYGSGNLILSHMPNINYRVINYGLKCNTRLNTSSHHSIVFLQHFQTYIVVQNTTGYALNNADVKFLLILGVITSA